MANPNANTQFDLSTAAGCEALYASVKRNLRREDFPSTPEGWKQFCGHKVRKHAKEIETAQRNKAYWESVMGGEHLQEAAAKVDALNKALAEAEQLKKELAELRSKTDQKSK